MPIRVNPVEPALAAYFFRQMDKIAHHDSYQNAAPETAATKTRETAKKAEARKDLSKSYNKFKQVEGQQYTGMKAGRSHKWYYDKGEWTERKITPDQWEISYAVTKRRVGKAPEGSGVPVGTENRRYIRAHQHVRKLNANDYTTH